MAIYTLSELRNQITDRIHENHERAIDGVDLQEMLQDIVDSLEKYTDDAVVEPAENYYADTLTFNEATKVLTITRTGKTPALANLSASLSTLLDQKTGEVALTPGDNLIPFTTSYPTGTTYIVFKEVISSDGYDIGGTVSAQTVNGFTINVKEASILKYIAAR